jgi:signal recognition particle subunit SRP54
MPENRLQRLHDAGQSIWLDFIDRSILRNGDLQRRLQDDSLTGMTSNPTICEKAIAEAKSKGCDVIIYDTAGRLAIDENLMQELADIKEKVEPENIYLVVDAMIGQDAVKVSKGFHDRLDLTGVILTKLDGDARGGAALSVKEVTGAGVRCAGIGEGTDKFEEFRPEGMASRVLGMGDVVGLMKDFQGVVDEQKAAEDAMKMLQGDFTLDDFLQQIKMISRWAA